MEQKEAILLSNSSSPEISVIIPTLNEGANLERTVASLRQTLPPESEILVVDDGSTDGSTGFLSRTPEVRWLRTEQIGCARARNYGASQARSQVIVFSDAHMTVPNGWWLPLVSALEDPQVGAAAPAITVMGRPDSKGFGLQIKGPDLSVDWLPRWGRSPYPVPVVGGAFLAMRREVFQATGGFDDGMIRWGSNDLELSLRLWLLGYELRVVPQVEVAHLFRSRHPYAVDWTAVLHNLLRVAFVHFSPERIARVTNALKSHKAFAAALALNAGSNVWSRRSNLNNQRCRSDDWYFHSFGMIC